MWNKVVIIGLSIWANFPFLKKYAEDFLSGDEAFELAKATERALNSTNPGNYVYDEYDISLAFDWANSLQGYDYWATIFKRNFDTMHRNLDAGVYCPPDPIFIGVDAAEEVKQHRTYEWVPDQARDDTMDITRGMFE